MKENLRLSIMVVALLALTVAAGAQLGYELDWRAVPGGGGQSVGGSYALSGGFLPQAQIMTGQSFELCSGFYVPNGQTGEMMPRLWLPVLVKGQGY